MISQDSRADALLEVDEVSVDYGRVRALRPTSLRLADGEMALVLGPNGAGKTSLLGAIAGHVGASSGRVRLAGAEVTRVPAHRRVKLGVSLVPEGRGTLPGLSVLDNLDLGWRGGPAADRDARRRHMDEIFELFPVLRERLEQDCSTLSGGEMQMLAIARAVLARPRVLLLDEPSLGLAPRAAVMVHTALRQLSESGRAMILVEQKALTIDWTPDITVVLRRGEVVLRTAHERPSEQQLAELYLGHLAKV